MDMGQNSSTRIWTAGEESFHFSGATHVVDSIFSSMNFNSGPSGGHWSLCPPTTFQAVPHVNSWPHVSHNQSPVLKWPSQNYVKN